MKYYDIRLALQEDFANVLNMKPSDEGNYIIIEIADLSNRAMQFQLNPNQVDSLIDMLKIMKNHITEEK